MKTKKPRSDEAENRSNGTTRKQAIDKTANCHNYKMTKMQNGKLPEMKNDKLIKRGINKQRIRCCDTLMKVRIVEMYNLLNE